MWKMCKRQVAQSVGHSPVSEKGRGWVRVPGQDAHLSIPLTFGDEHWTVTALLGLTKAHLMSV